jgi:hypothetical protein
MSKPKQRAGRRPQGPARTAAAPRPPVKPGPASAAAPAALKPDPPAAAPAPPPVSVPRPVPLPRSVRSAVWLMYAGAVLAALDLIATLAASGGERAEMHRANPSWSPTLLTTEVRSFILGIVVIWAVTIGAWLIMARISQAGRAWTRNVATVLCALSTLSFILYLHEPGSLISRLLLAPMWLVGVAAVTLLWRPDSTAYIRAGVA